MRKIMCVISAVAVVFVCDLQAMSFKFVASGKSSELESSKERRATIEKLRREKEKRAAAEREREAAKEKELKQKIEKQKEEIIASDSSPVADEVKLADAVIKEINKLLMGMRVRKDLSRTTIYGEGGVSIDLGSRFKNLLADYVDSYTKHWVGEVEDYTQSRETLPPIEVCIGLCGDTEGEVRDFFESKLPGVKFAEAGSEDAAEKMKKIDEMRQKTIQSKEK